MFHAAATEHQRGEPKQDGGFPTVQRRLCQPMKTDNLFVPHMCANHPADNLREAGAQRPEKMNAHASDAGPHHL